MDFNVPFCFDALTNESIPMQNVFLLLAPSFSQCLWHPHMFEGKTDSQFDLFQAACRKENWMG